MLEPKPNQSDKITLPKDKISIIIREPRHQITVDEYTLNVITNTLLEFKNWEQRWQEVLVVVWIQQPC